MHKMTMMQWESTTDTNRRKEAMNDNTSVLATPAPPTLFYERHHYLSYKQNWVSFKWAHRLGLIPHFRLSSMGFIHF